MKHDARIVMIVWFTKNPSTNPSPLSPTHTQTPHTHLEWFVDQLHSSISPSKLTTSAPHSPILGVNHFLNTKWWPICLIFKSPNKATNFLPFPPFPMPAHLSSPCIDTIFTTPPPWCFPLKSLQNYQIGARVTNFKKYWAETIAILH